MQVEGIKVQQTYRTNAGKLVYVQDIYSHTTPLRADRRVIWNKVGDLERFDSTLASFASRAVEAAPNQ